jgi:hypothetical protein
MEQTVMGHAHFIHPSIIRQCFSPNLGPGINAFMRQKESSPRSPLI